MSGSPGPASDGRRLAAGSRDSRRASESLVSARPSVSSSEDLTTPQRSFDSAGGPGPGAGPGARSLLEEPPEPPTATPAAAPAAAPSTSSPAPRPAKAPAQAPSQVPGPSPAGAVAAKEEEPPSPKQPHTEPPPQAPPPQLPQLPQQTPQPQPSLSKQKSTDSARQDRQDSREERQARFEDRAQQTDSSARPHRHYHKEKKAEKKVCAACLQDPNHCRTIKKGVRKKSSSSGTPLISVSSVVDDTFDNSDETAARLAPAPSPLTDPCAPAMAAEAGAAGGDPSLGALPAGPGAQSAAGTAGAERVESLVAPLAQQEDEGTAPPSPLAGPSCSPSHCVPPPLAASKSEDRASVERASSQEGKVNEICPWEDE